MRPLQEVSDEELKSWVLAIHHETQIDYNSVKRQLVDWYGRTSANELQKLIESEAALRWAIRMSKHGC